MGKGALIKKLMAAYPGACGFSVSHTTRAPRLEEENGVHYHFVEMQMMKRELDDGKFIEHASVHGNLYGASIAAVEAVRDSGRICVLDIDVQGVRQIKENKTFPGAKFLFICPPSLKELEKRLRDRGTESEEKVQTRLQNAGAEIEAIKEDGLFDHVLTNDSLDECEQRFLALACQWYPALAQGKSEERDEMSKKPTTWESGSGFGFMLIPWVGTC